MRLSRALQDARRCAAAPRGSSGGRAAPKQIASQKSCDPKVAGSKGGNAPCSPPPCASVARASRLRAAGAARRAAPSARRTARRSSARRLRHEAAERPPRSGSPQTAKIRRSAISSEKMPSASVTAKPKISAAELAVGGRRVADRARRGSGRRASRGRRPRRPCRYRRCRLRSALQHPLPSSKLLHVVDGCDSVSATGGWRRSGTCRSGWRRHRPAGRRPALRARSAPRSWRTG